MRYAIIAVAMILAGCGIFGPGEFKCETIYHWSLTDSAVAEADSAGLAWYAAEPGPDSVRVIWSKDGECPDPDR